MSKYVFVIKKIMNKIKTKHFMASRRSMSERVKFIFYFSFPGCLITVTSRSLISNQQPFQQVYHITSFNVEEELAITSLERLVDKADEVVQ